MKTDMEKPSGAELHGPGTGKTEREKSCKNPRGRQNPAKYPPSPG
jgi:hypothetical protein